MLRAAIVPALVVAKMPIRRINRLSWAQTRRIATGDNLTGIHAPLPLTPQGDMGGAIVALRSAPTSPVSITPMS